MHTYVPTSLPCRLKNAGKAKAKPKAVAVVAATSEFSLELRGGEKGRSNTEYLLVLEDALVVIDANPMFSNMVREPPRPISNTTAGTDFHSVFDMSHYVNAMKSSTYKPAAISSGWICGGVRLQECRCAWRRCNNWQRRHVFVAIDPTIIPLSTTQVSPNGARVLS